MTPSQLTTQLREFTRRLIAPVSTAARVRVRIVQMERPCIAEIEIKAAPTKAPKIRVRLGERSAFQAEWLASFPAGFHLVYDPDAVTLEGDQVTARLHLPMYSIKV